MSNKFECKNCLALMDDDDKYCRCCGTKKGEGSYSPTSESMLCIYGPPPIKRTYKCNSCGYSWDEYEMIPRRKYCPKCRSSCSYTEGDDDWDSVW